jgi:hypothetical protein
MNLNDPIEARAANTMKPKYIQELKPYDCYKDSDVSNFHYKMFLPDVQEELGWDNIFYCYITDWKFSHHERFKQEVLLKITNNKVWNDPQTKVGYIGISTKKSKTPQFAIGDKDFYYKIKEFGEMTSWGGEYEKHKTAAMKYDIYDFDRKL